MVYQAHEGLAIFSTQSKTAWADNSMESGVTLFLIAHKVRGLPAFDIAERCEEMGTPSDPGPWWIIPTSGRRAYPGWALPLESIVTSIGGPILLHKCNLPESLRDHYEAGAIALPKIETINLEDLL